MIAMLWTSALLFVTSAAGSNSTLPGQHSGLDVSALQFMMPMGNGDSKVYAKCAAAFGNMSFPGFDVKYVCDDAAYGLSAICLLTFGTGCMVCAFGLKCLGHHWFAKCSSCIGFPLLLAGASCMIYIVEHKSLDPVMGRGRCLPEMTCDEKYTLNPKWSILSPLVATEVQAMVVTKFTLSLPSADPVDGLANAAIDLVAGLVTLLIITCISVILFALNFVLLAAFTYFHVGNIDCAVAGCLWLGPSLGTMVLGWYSAPLGLIYMGYSFFGILSVKYKAEQEETTMFKIYKTTVLREWFINTSVDVFMMLNQLVHLLGMVVAYFQALVLVATLLVPIAKYTGWLNWTQALACQCFGVKLPQIMISLWMFLSIPTDHVSEFALYTFVASFFNLMKFMHQLKKSQYEPVDSVA